LVRQPDSIVPILRNDVLLVYSYPNNSALRNNTQL